MSDKDAILLVLQQEVEELRQESDKFKEHRTVVKTLLTLAGASAALVVLGAVNVRDSTLNLASKIDSQAARITALEVSAGRRDTDDRATSAAIVRLQTTMEALQSTVVQRLDSLDRNLASRITSTDRRRNE